MLGEEAARIFNRVYGVEADGNAPAGCDPHGRIHGQNTLIERLSVADAAKLFKKSEDEVAASLADSRKKLFDVRAKRPRPHLDDKIITAWNGMMISAFARAAQILDDRALPRRRAGVREIHPRTALERWRAHPQLPRRRERRSPGFADDYAALIPGLLDLYEADFDIAWLQWAVELQEKQDALFLDAEHGGYFSTAADATTSAPAHEGRLRRRRTVAEFRERAESAPPRANHRRRDAHRARTENHRRRLRTTRPHSQPPCRKCSAPSTPRSANPARSSSPARAIPPPRARCSAKSTRITFPTNSCSSPTAAAGQQWLGERLEFLKTVAPIEGRTRRLRLRRFRLPAPNEPTWRSCGSCFPNRPLMNARSFAAGTLALFVTGLVCGWILRPAINRDSVNHMGTSAMLNHRSSGESRGVSDLLPVENPQPKSFATRFDEIRRTGNRFKRERGVAAIADDLDLAKIVAALNDLARSGGVRWDSEHEEIVERLFERWASLIRALRLSAR